MLLFLGTLRGVFALSSETVKLSRSHNFSPNGPFFLFQAASRPGEVPQVIRAYFELLYRFLLFCPAALVGSPELDTALQLALACVGGLDMDRESARAVLFFVGQLAGRCMGQLDRYRGEVEAALAAHGEGLTRLMFAALAVSDRTSCCGSVARDAFLRVCKYNFFQSCPNACHQCSPSW